MATKVEDEKNIDYVIVFKRTRDVLIIQEGNMMRKYWFDREWEVNEKNEKKTKKEKKEQVAKKLPKRGRTTTREKQKTTDDGKQKQQTDPLHEISCK